jgi:hypothetical protein
MRYWKKTWKTAVATALLSVAAGPALASDGVSDARADAAEPSASAADLAGAHAREERPLEERVGELEKRVDQLGAPRPSPAPTDAERMRLQHERGRQAEFLSPGWTAP